MIKVLVAVGFFLSTVGVVLLICVKSSQASRHRAGHQLMLSKMVPGQTASPGPAVYIGVHRDETRSDPDPDMADISLLETDELPIRPSNIGVGPMNLGPIVSARIKSLANKRGPARVPKRDYETVPPPPPPPPHRRWVRAAARLHGICLV